MHFLHKNSSAKTTFLKDVIEKLDYQNVFNPSVWETVSESILTLRVKSLSRLRKFDSMLIVLQKKSRSMEVVNLSEVYYQQWGINYCNDPKLFEFDNEVFITFNTGYEKDGNLLYIARVRPEIMRPWECRYAGRDRIEKNWAFFGFNGQLYAYYSLNPLIILHAPKFENRHSDVIMEFERKPLQTEMSLPRRYSLATQPIRFNDWHYLIAHYKILIGRKRLYLGRFIRIDQSQGLPSALAVGRNFLAHDIKSLFGSKEKHNKNLISCSYFSGLCWNDDSLLVSYGINDLTYNIAALEKIDTLF